MKNPQIVFLVIIVAVGLLFGGYLLNPGTNGDANPTVQPQPTAIADSSLISNDLAPLIGNKDAKVKIVVFSDYLCPYCKTAHELIVGILKDNSDVSLTMRSFIVHEEARILAQAAEAANQQGKFEQMNDAIFADEAEPNEDSVKQLAEKLGLDLDQFTKDLNSDEIKSRVSKDEQDALALGLQGTPSVYLNNAPVSNFNDLPQLVKASQ